MWKRIALGAFAAALALALVSCAGTSSNTEVTASAVDDTAESIIESATPAAPAENGATDHVPGTPMGKPAGAQSGTPQANADPDEWLTLEGTVVSASNDLVEIKTDKGVIAFEGRPLSYALEKRFRLEVGDAVWARGFEENGTFRLGEVKNLASGASITLRDASGKPVWSGRGSGGG